MSYSEETIRAIKSKLGFGAMSQLIMTEDGQKVYLGDRAYNYYDHKPGVIAEIDMYPEINPLTGDRNNYWFGFKHDDGTFARLDGSRICSIMYATNRGWITK